LERDRGQEKNRNLKVLEVMNKKREIEMGGKVNGNLVGATAKPKLVHRKKSKQTGKKN